MSRFLLVSRSAEYESRLRRLLRSHLQSVPGEYLIFGPDELAAQVEGQPRVALLGPLLTYEETRTVSAALAKKFPGIGTIVVREQRSDLEDWVDDMQIHAVLSPEAADATVEALLGRLDNWLVASGRLAPAPIEDEPADETDETTPRPLVEILDAELAAAEAASESEAAAEAAAAAAAAVIAAEPAPEWELPDLGPGVRSEILVVAAPKGGQGKTTLAVNLAAGLAEVAPNSVVLVDGDLQFGDIANMLNLNPHYSLVDAMAVAGDTVALRAVLTRHDDDFFVLPAPASPESADTLAAEAFATLLGTLATLFRFVVVDTTPGLGEHTLTALEHATDGVFVSALTVPGLRALRREFEVLVPLGLLPPNRHLIVNFVEKNNGLLIKDAEAIVGAPFDIAIPRSLEVVLAANAGEPIIHRDVRDAAAKSLRSLVLRIEPTAVPTRRRIHRRARRTDEPE